MKFDAQIVLSILLALFFVRLLARFFNLAERRPRWNKLLNWIWVPGIGLGVVDLLFNLRSDQLDEVYMLFVYGVVIAILVDIRGYRPARTVLLALLPYVAYLIIELVLAVSELKLSENVDDAFDSSQGFTVIWLITFLLIARNQKKNRWSAIRRSRKGSALPPRTWSWNGWWPSEPLPSPSKRKSCSRPSPI
jgi:two-component system NtrC family sensor kinase